MDSLSEETVFLDVDAIFFQTWRDQVRAKLDLLRLDLPALAKTAFDPADAR